MATKPTQKKQPFVIEPLNWAAPAEAQRDETETRSDGSEKSSRKKEAKS